MESESSLAFRSLSDNTPDGLAYCRMIFDERLQPVDFVFLDINENFWKLTGLKDVVGRKATELIPGIAKGHPELFEICSRISSKGRQVRFETYFEVPSKWFLVSVFSPKEKFFVAVFQDITLRKQMENDLKNEKIAARNVMEDLTLEKSKLEMARAKEEAILLSIGDGLLVTDERGDILLINAIAERLLGKKNEEVMGKFFPDVISIEDESGSPIPLEKHPINIALNSFPSSGVSTSYYLRKKQRRIPVSIMVTPVILEGKVIGTIEVFRDITKEKEIDRVKTEFVSLASHQLRTPLSTVNWYAEMLLDGDAGKLNEEQKKYMEEVYRGNQRMVALVNALLNVSRLELGTFVFEPEEVDVALLIGSVVSEQKPQMDAKHIIYSESFATGIPLIQSDPKLLRMVLQNLLSNAIKYNHENGTVHIDLRVIKRGELLNHRKTNQESLLIVVSDSGYGIPKHQQDKIFTKLFRADNAREKDTEGTGLGLYIAKSVIDHSGGMVWFESEEESGTTFHVVLPLVGFKKKESTLEVE